MAWVLESGDWGSSAGRCLWSLLNLQGRVDHGKNNEVEEGWEAERVLGEQNLVDDIGPAGRQIIHLLAQYLSMCLTYNDSQTTIFSSHFTFSPDTMTKTVLFTKDPINPQLCLQVDHWVVGKNAACTPRLKKKS